MTRVILSQRRIRNSLATNEGTGPRRPPRVCAVFVLRSPGPDCVDFRKNVSCSPSSRTADGDPLCPTRRLLPRHRPPHPRRRAGQPSPDTARSAPHAGRQRRPAAERTLALPGRGRLRTLPQPGRRRGVAEPCRGRALAGRDVHPLTIGRHRPTHRAHDRARRQQPRGREWSRHALGRPRRDVAPTWSPPRSPPTVPTRARRSTSVLRAIGPSPPARG